MRIYTLGYSGRTPEQVEWAALLRSAVLVDVRLRPRSRDPAWTAGRLRAALGDRYVHLRGFGNLNYRGDGPIRLADFAGALAELRDWLDRTGGENVMLLCVCRDVETCHRRVVAERLAEALGGTIEHL